MKKTKTKRKRLYVYVNEDEYDFFKDLAKLKTGKNNLSLLVRVLLAESSEKMFRQLVQSFENESQDEPKLSELNRNKIMDSEDAVEKGGISSLPEKRFSLRLPSDDMAYFNALAKQA